MCLLLFAEEGITLDLLKDFVEEKHLLESLVPRIGDRLRLAQKIKDYFNAGKESEYTVIYDQEPSIENNQINEDLILLSPSTVSVSTISTPAASTSFDLITEPPPRKKSNNLNSFITNLDLKELLDSSALGKALLSWYCVKGALDTARQGYLVDIITTEIINRGFTHLTNSDYSILSQKIVEVFPSEITEVYYLAPVKKKDSPINKPGLAKGKLVDKFRNRLTFFREARILPSRTNSEVLSSSIQEAEEEHVEDQSLDYHIQWLYHNREPLEDVYKHWDSLFSSRRQKLLKEGGDLTEFYKEYPILKESICLSLIEKKKSKKSIFLTWEPTITKLITLRRQYVISDTDKVLLDLLQSSCLENDYRVLLMFSLLPTLLPNRSRHVYGRSRKQ
ncbi:uncharacterized protein LOC123321926 [Coccinella septempunctata]|uniref:uncharacterized protein LOC123321926 n=1 Tax=Coccinella septempunctata TaxID=41139 RepID=UPI001D0937CC|nr:uncharacterized protein LOC123321926 [Coccinella septempunctata]